ncbi:MAG: TetR/AcrR family transcriptional regulator [Lachnospiraceae bacterium]|nr:TetR/AcrR family transcriptional regulator [Candidatus Equihabitans merdae]
MEKSIKTKNRMMDAMEQLLSEKPYDRITITDITDKCNVTRQVFYKYFINKEDIIANLNQRILCEWTTKADTFTWDDMVEKMMDSMINHREFYESTNLVDDKKFTEKNLFKTTYYLYYALVCYALKSEPSEDLDALIKMCCHGGVYMAVEWASDGMKMSKDNLKDIYYRGMPVELRDIIMGVEFPGNFYEGIEVPGM